MNDIIREIEAAQLKQDAPEFNVDRKSVVWERVYVLL